jgi:Transglutaminase-like superfamily
LRRVRTKASWTLAVLALVGCTEQATETVRPIDIADEVWSVVKTRLRPGMSDEQKVIAIAEWVAANSTNQPREPGAETLPFWGLCGRRASVFVRLAQRAGFEARSVYFERFVDSSHAAAQVRFGGRWHYFDVTYAGYFRNGQEIVSLDELRADSERAIAGMVIFPFTHDRWSDGQPVSNRLRMQRNYTPENIRTATGKVCRQELEPRPDLSPAERLARRECEYFGTLQGAARKTPVYLARACSNFARCSAMRLRYPSGST